MCQGTQVRCIFREKCPKGATCAHAKPHSHDVVRCSPQRCVDCCYGGRIVWCEPGGGEHAPDAEDDVKLAYPKAELQTRSGSMHRVVVPIDNEEMKRLRLRKPFKVVGGWSTSEPGAWCSALNRI